ncbi:MAG: hypothetical protein ACF8GE_10930 [Phycisphaerales bacterium JB043]
MTRIRVRLAQPDTRPTTPTRRACQVARLLGYSLEGEQPARNDRASVRSSVVIDTGYVVLVSGASGSGKSTTLGAIVAEARSSGWHIIDVGAIRLGARVCVDLHPRLDLDRTLALLSAVGLSEARVLVSRAPSLSDGQRDRLRMARAMANAMAHRRSSTSSTMVVVDECCARLDRLTARCVAALLARMSRSMHRLALVVASSHDDLRACLGPDIEIRCSLSASPAVLIAERQIAIAPVTVACEVVDSDEERRALLRRFCPMHYRGGRPATIAQLRVARHATSGDALGVLIVSSPTLNARHRALAWPGRYTGGDRGVCARRLNREVRCLSRTIVDPRVRGVGVATRLVQSYLDSPLTARTEAIAAMGKIARFHERAGMRAWAIPPDPPDARLLDALEHAGIESWRLAQPLSVWRRLESGGQLAFITREIDIWSRAGRSRAWASPRRWEDDHRSRFVALCARVHEGYVAYTHDAQGGDCAPPIAAKDTHDAGETLANR